MNAKFYYLENQAQKEEEEEEEEEEDWATSDYEAWDESVQANLV